MNPGIRYIYAGGAEATVAVFKLYYFDIALVKIFSSSPRSVSL
jgi:hypothetical protein